jgi:hypothetical protein
LGVKILSDLQLFDGSKEEEPNDPLIDTPVDMRPDLSEYGFIEHDRGIVEDTYENRSLLRQHSFQWVPVYTENGHPTGLIEARSIEQMKERRLMSLSSKRALLSDPLSNNSDYLTGLDLIVDSEACRLVPPWVLGATKAYIKEQEDGGPPTARRAPKALPARCRAFTSEGIRCMLWSSGRIKDDGLCRLHLGANKKTGADIERARKKLMQSAPYAVDKLEELMENAVSEPVKLKAATEILDRAGIRAGMEIDLGVELKDARTPAEIIAERLARLKAGAEIIQGELVQHADEKEAEVVLELDADQPKIFTPQPTESESTSAISAEELEELQ